jgi:ribonuclease P protein component
MLPKKERILKKDFEKIYKNSINVSRGSFFVLKKSNILDGFHLAVVVSKKITKISPNRNYLKRVVFNIFKSYKNKLDNSNFIFIFQKRPKNFKELKEDIENNLFQNEKINNITH